MKDVKYKSVMDTLFNHMINWDSASEEFWKFNNKDLKEFGDILIENILNSLKENHVQDSQIQKIKNEYL